jgi:hypothetical protein
MREEKDKLSETDFKSNDVKKQKTGREVFHERLTAFLSKSSSKYLSSTLLRAATMARPGNNQFNNKSMMCENNSGNNLPANSKPKVIVKRKKKSKTCPKKPKCPGNQAIVRGNGKKGKGKPGERQVNNPKQDKREGKHITQSETSMARHGSNILFGFNDSNCSRADNYSGFAFSSDGGATWCDGGSMPRPKGGGNFGDPVIAVDSNGVFYYAHLGTLHTGESVIQVSTAKRKRKKRKIKINPPIPIGFGVTDSGIQDKEWITVGKDLLNPVKEALYITWTDFELSGQSINFAKYITGKKPAPLISSKPIVIGEVQGSFPVVDSIGVIYVFYEDFSSGKSIRVVKSTDGGITFSPPIIVSSVTTAGNAIMCGGNDVIQVSSTKSIRTNEFPHAAIGPDNTLYVVWNDSINLATTGIDIYLAYSQDGGLTWTKVQVTNTPTHEFMPSVTANTIGAHIQYSRFNDPANVSGVGNGTFALFQKSFSIGGGLSSETMVSSVFSPVPDTVPNFDPAIANCYMGDYNQIITGRGLSLLHAWSDNRNRRNGNNPDVFFIQN